MRWPFVATMLAVAGLAACTSAGGITQNAGEKWSFTRSREIFLSPPDSIRLELRPGDLTHEVGPFMTRITRRNEIRLGFDIRASMGEARHYIWSFYLDENTDWKKVQSLFGQMHSGTGVTTNHHTLVIFEQHFYEGNLIITWQGHTEDERVPSVVGSAKVPNVEPGRWYTYALEVRFSNGPGGYVRLWVDGDQVIDYAGPFGVRNGRHYLRIGFYEPDEIPLSEQQVKVVYLDDIHVGAGGLPGKYKR